MKVTLLVVGKTDERYIKEGIELYAKRLKHYADFKVEIIPDIKKAKNTTTELQKIKEGEHILSKWMPAKEFHLFNY